MRHVLAVLLVLVSLFGHLSAERGSASDADEAMRSCCEMPETRHADLSCAICAPVPQQIPADHGDILIATLSDPEVAGLRGLTVAPPRGPPRPVSAALA